MNIKTFADGLADVVFAGITRRFDGIPKTLAAADLPAMWIDMPIATISPVEPYGTFAESGARYTTNIYVAAALVSEGYPDAQRTAVLNIAAAIEEWARETAYTLELLDTRARLGVANIEYRGVIARITAENME